MSKLRELMGEGVSAARVGDAVRCAEPVAGSTRQVEGLRSEGRFSGLTITIDEPVYFGGTALAPNPAEVALAALGASIEVTLRCYAEYLEIPLQSVSVELASALDSRGFYDTDASVPSGFATVRARILIRSEAPAADVRRLIERVERCCPILNTFRSPVDVQLSVHHEGRT